jgi:hypothetical protein
LLSLWLPCVCVCVLATNTAEDHGVTARS